MQEQVFSVIVAITRKPSTSNAGYAEAVQGAELMVWLWLCREYHVAKPAATAAEMAHDRLS